MNIAFFSDSYRPYFSGVVKSIDSFKKELEKKGHFVYIFAPDYPSVDEEEGIYRFASLPTPTKKDFRLAIPISNKISSLLKRLEIDIIHTHTPFLMGGLARYVARKLDIPLVFTYHTLYEEYVHYVPLVGNLARGVTIRYVKDFCRSCNLIIAPSGYVEKRIKNYQIDRPVLTIPTGLELDIYRNRNEKLLEEIRNDYKLDKFALKLVFVGRLGEEKNVSFLLRAFNFLVREHGLDACLIVIGSGPDRDKLEKYCLEEGLSD
ncbi:MAG: glycosyltransferase family 4 protein, partial [Halanaerobiaceae bacterium]|nr:glycosyltransferase family 4 protein [Halanaerobiaceae bacterium]